MTKEEDINKLVDYIYDMEEYLYHWCCCYDNELHNVDHSHWNNFCLTLFQKYHFNILDIQQDIINGTIIYPTYITKNPKILTLHDKLLEAHIKNVKEYEKKLNINII